ncbi:MAG: SRPBCC family protein [Lewinellaceae bacterium]|nr:SRPBCC family protein [Lewinellaceae bacterium]
MKALKTVLIVIGILLGIFLLLGLFAPKEVQATQSIVINAPPETVFNTVNDLSTWDSWSPWKEADPSITSTLGEQTVGAGAYYTWTSENSGTGKISITESTPAESVRTVVDFGGKGMADTPFAFKPVENGTETSWSFHSKFPYPWNAMLLFQDFKGNIEKDYARGLELLKAVVEEKAKAMAAQSALAVQELELPARYYIGIREKASMGDLAARFAENFPKVYEGVTKAGLQMAGQPSALYYTWDEANQSTELAFAIPLKEQAQLKGFESINLPAGKILLIDYYGSYEGIGDAHVAMDKYLAANGLTATAPVIEEYITDPQSEPDTTKWLTKVYYPVAK